MRTTFKIKSFLIGLAVLFIGIVFIPSGIADDTVLFLQPVTSPPPPAVAILLDTSGSMSSLPCAVPDMEDSCGLTDDGSSYFITQWGYHPNTDYGYDSNNTTCFDSNVSPGQAGCFYGGTDPNQAHVYINGYFAYNTVDNVCNQIPQANSGEPYGSRWYDCGTINYFCNNESVLGIPAGQCINNLTQYGYQYAGADYEGNDEAYFSGNLLEFYPPKFVITRKVMSDLITYNSNLYTNGKGVRIGVFSFNSSSYGAEADIKIYPPCSQLGSNPTPGNYLNTLYSLKWDHSTPLAGALVQVGGYFANNNSNATFYNNLGCNGSSYCSGLSGASLGAACSANDSWCGCYNTNYSCEKNFVIVMTDGNENAGPSGLPNWPIGSYDLSTVNESACSNAPGDSCNIDEVAGFLNAKSIRPATELPPQCTTNIDTYTIGFAGTAANGIALNTYALQLAANNGGGMFAPASSWQTLEAALYKFFADINQKNHSYGAPSVPTIRTSNQTNVYLASFIPSVNNFWQGDLRAYTGAVISGPTGPVFTLFDATGAPFTGESGTGQCSLGTVPPPLWDAAACLITPSSCGASPSCNTPGSCRTVYTITRLTNPGFTAVPDNGATILQGPIPPVTLGSANLFTTTNTNLIPSDFGLAADDFTDMDSIIDYVLGPKDAKGHVLGDIDHSDPTTVDVDNTDTLAYLNGGPPLLPPRQYYQEFLNAIYNQPRIVIAGADDGMIHAFDAGSLTSATVQEGNYEPFSAYYSAGTGRELWAFIPNDLLPKLQYMWNTGLLPTTTTGAYWTAEGTYITTNTSHVFYVDGAPLIRDVYLPGDDNGLGLSDDAAYWHTVMIIGERLGGVYYIALDITDRLHPKFMWEFTDQDMGFTYSQVFGHSAPMGPVWLGYNFDNPSQITTTTRWVAWLSAGDDLSESTPIYNWRGRGFYIIDLKTGQKIWEDHSMAYPTPATPGGVQSTLNGFDEIFLPDLGGDVWRYNLGSNGTPGAYSSTGEVRTCLVPSINTNCWSTQLIFQAPQYPSPSFPQKFFYIPSITFMPFPPYDVRLGVGAGDRMNPLLCSPPDNNRFYSFISPQLYATQTTYGGSIPLTEANLTQILPGSNASLQSNGWYITVSSFTGTGSGSKNLAPALFFDNMIFFTLFTPKQSACVPASTTQFSCRSAGGSGVLVGLSYTGSIGAGQYTYQSLGSGVPAAPTTFMQLIPGGYVQSMIVGGSEFSVTSIGGSPTTNYKLKTLYLLELPEYLYDILQQQPW
ncbi:MAG: PilC/PilY family type IV pilus protein [Deltaproteobacteria bacterium]|nr:PilC/PilY family type IV pilus protein [Deltaproteobacteria bacterium]MCL5792942.1 PilC/PilY family type IV pilus protein [Deltaproteobacteria bacterium]